MYIVALPIGHGKTTLHCPEKGIYDAAEVINDPATLSKIRQKAFETGNWNSFDEEYSTLIKAHLNISCKVLLVSSPQVNINHNGLYSYIIPRERIVQVLTHRPKKGINRSLEMYDDYVDRFGPLSIMVKDHDEITLRIMTLLSELSKESIRPGI